MAGVNNSTLYPPNIDTMMPAFIQSQGECRVYFSLSVMTDVKQINKSLVQVAVNNQNTNLSELDSQKYPVGIKLATLQIDENKSGNDKYYITVSASDLKDKIFETGRYYKVQIRLTSSELKSQSKYGASWFNQNVQYFSEWSTVCLIRAIDKPQININFYGSEETGIYVVSSTNIDVNGSIVFDEKDNDRLKYYNIKVYDKDNNLIQTSDDIYTSTNYIDYTFIQELETGNQYKMNIFIQTALGYEEVYTCDFIVQEDSFLAFESNVVLKAVNEPDIGGIRISAEYEGGDGQLRSNITYRRASSEDNFKSWIDVKTVAINQDTFHHEWYDLTVKSGVQYIYKVQRRASVGIRGTASNPSEPITADYEDIFLTAEGKNLRVRYNPKVSSYKITVLENKTETLGSKYPFIKRNGNVYYHTIQFSGIISMQSDLYIEPEENVGYRSLMSHKPLDVYEEARDENGNFLGLVKVQEEKLTSDSVWKSVWKPNNSIDPVRKYNYNLKRNPETDSYFKEKDMLQEDYVAERDYRDEVMEFLYKHNIKLMRTDTEGNFLVKLMDINLTPAGIGRQLYQFTATAHEVAEFNFYNINYYNIQNTGLLQDIADEKLILGQYLSKGDLEADFTFDRILEGDLMDALTDKYANYLNIPGLSATATELKFVRIEIDEDQPPYVTSQGLLGYEVVINSIPIYIKPNQIIYELRGDDVSITSLYFPKQTKCLIDYVVKIEIKEDVSQLKKNYRHEIRVGQIYDLYYPNTDLLKEITDKYTYESGKKFSHILSINDINIEAPKDTVFEIGFNNEDYSEFTINDYNVLNLCDNEKLMLTHFVVKSIGGAEEILEKIKKLLAKYETLSEGSFLNIKGNFLVLDKKNFVSVPTDPEVLSKIEQQLTELYEELEKYKILVDYCIELERGEYY